MALLPLGLLAGAAAPLYLAVLDQAHALFRRWHAPLWLAGHRRPAGGLISLLSPEVWGNGYSVVNAILQDHWSMAALLAVLFWKVLAVSATSGSGAVGGIFTPTLFVGAVLGALFGALLQQLGLAWCRCPWRWSSAWGLPGGLHPCAADVHPDAVRDDPELQPDGAADGHLRAGLPRLAALRVRSIYAAHQEQLKPAAALTIADLLHADPPTVAPGQSMQVVEERFRQSRWQHVYVTDAAGRFLGAIPLQDFRLQLLPDGTAAEQPWPPQLLRANYPRVRLEAPAWEVLECSAATRASCRCWTPRTA
jgi:CIC family chloride channel protein